jgi:hypothetical protein
LPFQKPKGENNRMTKKIQEVNNLLAQAILDCGCSSCVELVRDTLTPSEAKRFWGSACRLIRQKEEK